MRRHAPAITAFVLSPLLAELLTSSSPPREFFRPVTLILLLGLYGSGVLLCHDLALRWRRGWPGILILGLAYGVIEEGLCCQSCFNPEWPDLGLLGSYGRFLGVNWVWAEILTVFHALYSIALPIVIVELIWPQARNRLWVEDLNLPALELALLAATLFGLFGFPYHAGVWQYLGGAGVAALLVWRARAWRPRHVRPPRALRPFVVGLLAFAFTLALVAAMQLLPKLQIFSLLVIVILPGLFWAPARWFARRVAGGWSDRHALALVTGVLWVWIPLAAASERVPGRPDDPSGMSLVAVAAALGWLLLRRRVRRRIRESGESTAEVVFLTEARAGQTF